MVGYTMLQFSITRNNITVHQQLMMRLLVTAVLTGLNFAYSVKNTKS